MTVETFRVGHTEKIDFIEGVFNRRTIDAYNPGTTTGTIVMWTPSEEFFTNVQVEESKVRDLFKTIVCLCPGLTINFNIWDTIDHIESENVYTSTNGLNDLVDEAVKDKEIINNRFDMKFEEGKNKMDMVLTYTSNYSSTMVPYVNTGLTEK